MFFKTVFDIMSGNRRDYAISSFDFRHFWTVHSTKIDVNVDALDARPIVFGVHTPIAWKRKVDTTRTFFLL